MAQVVEKNTSPRRAEMVGAAAKLFSQRGYHGTSMRDLGDALGLLRGSLYAHIGSKEELLFEVVEQGADRFLERGRKAMEMQALAAVKLRNLLIWHIETAIEHLDAATVFLNEWRYLSPPLQEIIQVKRDEYEEFVRTIIREGVERGEFRDDVDVRLAATLVLSAGNWTYAWFKPGGEMGPHEIGRKFADLILEGMKREG